MNDFWNNISRYPRFFVSSMVGLVFVILTPVKTLVKVKKFQSIVIIGFIVIFIILYKVLLTMTGL
jgi:hypothetical protein|uniref:Uncharacterized protein ycf33 n=1 Tax=Gomphoneis minuta var. cassieae TaxID=1142141 RepID=A0A2H4MQ75_9STRA|nr:hypothetical protein [Gomphoneis minuta var. cassieae]